MANHYSANVIFVDTTAATYEGPKRIKAVKYLGNASGAAAILSKNSNGKTLWEADGTADYVDDIWIFASDGIYVTVTSGAKVYIYLE